MANSCPDEMVFTVESNREELEGDKHVTIPGNAAANYQLLFRPFKTGCF